MFRTILLQFFATLVASLFTGLMFGASGMFSTMLGGLAVVVPNLLFALRLNAIKKKPGASYPAAFFIGEFIKIASTIVLLVIAAALYRDVHWLALLIGLVVALKANLFALLLKH